MGIDNMFHPFPTRRKVVVRHWAVTVETYVRLEVSVDMSPIRHISSCRYEWQGEN